MILSWQCGGENVTTNNIDRYYNPVYPCSYYVWQCVITTRTSNQKTVGWQVAKQCSLYTHLHTAKVNSSHKVEETSFKVHDWFSTPWLILHWFLILIKFNSWYQFLLLVRFLIFGLLAFPAELRLNEVSWSIMINCYETFTEIIILWVWNAIVDAIVKKKLQAQSVHD